ncbi:hypothetical protein PFISCL1PPCAC_22520, partial [Pristionchus fissidentatus]
LCPSPTSLSSRAQVHLLSFPPSGGSTTSSSSIHSIKKSLPSVYAMGFDSINDPACRPVYTPSEISNILISIAQCGIGE